MKQAPKESLLRKVVPMAGAVVTLGALWAMMTNRAGRERSAEYTPIPEGAGPDVIRDQFIDVEGFAPQDSTVAMLAAQSAIETGRWQKMRGYNFGNLVEGRANHDYYCLNHRKWRWYSTPQAGARDWMQLLRKRYPEAWKLALQGDDPEAFVRALKAGGYFEEASEGYETAVRSLYTEYLRKMRPDQPAPAPPSKSPGVIPGYRRAREDEVTPGMREAADVAIHENDYPIGTVLDLGYYKILIEWHNAGHTVKGASVFLPLGGQS